VSPERPWHNLRGLMPLTPGTRLGPYEVVAAIGAGGMGEVYRARDTKLGREVALKVLPESFSADADRLARFQREAHVLAALNHPHIAAIHGLEDSTAVTALVLELVDGDTLADRIAAGPMPLDEATAVASQIAEALESAHDQGIVHRDLKPANVKITPGGSVKVLDFGLAKLAAPPEVGGPPRGGHYGDRSVRLQPDLSPTITSPALATNAGVLLGTAAYMSPEQAKGRPADKRSDVWAFGCVFYEMLTGRRAFGGEDITETIAAVVRGEPDWLLLPRDLPPVLAAFLRRCLHKDRGQRVADMHDVRLALDGAFGSGAATDSGPAPQARASWRRMAIAAMLAAVVAAAIGAGVAWMLRPSSVQPVFRARFVLPEGQVFTEVSRQLVGVSPDGTRIAYSANGSLYVRSLADLGVRLVQGSDSGVGLTGAMTPVFSPDGRSIAFFAGSFKKIALDGGSAITLADGDPPLGMSWYENGILIGQGARGIVRVPADGGRAETIVAVPDGEIAAGPQMLPGGRAVLFTLASGQDYAANRWDTASIVAQSPGSSERKVIVEGGSYGRYVPTGHLVYATGGTLSAVPFDLERLEVTGAPVPVVDGVRRNPLTTFGAGTPHYAVSDQGSLVFVPGPAAGFASTVQIATVSRDGVLTRLPLPPNAYGSIRLSPNGRQLAFETDDTRAADVWIYEMSGATSPRRLTFGGRNRFPVWSRGGTRVLFQSDREGDSGLFWQPADGSGTAERLTKAENGAAHVPESWSPVDDRILFSVTSREGTSLWTLSLADRAPMPFSAVRSTAALNAEFSPDGKWIAYTIRSATEANIYVEPFPATGAKYQITTNNGHHPVWLPKGEGLSFRVGPAQQVAVRINPASGLVVSNPVPIVEGGLPAIGVGASRTYDVTPDGASFLTVVPAAGPRSRIVEQQEIEIVVNWFEELKRLVPTSQSR
jgi:eukaryotic-like serine/threonine-protein kinase